MNSCTKILLVNTPENTFKKFFSVCSLIWPVTDLVQVNAISAYNILMIYVYVTQAIKTAHSEVSASTLLLTSADRP